MMHRIKLKASTTFNLCSESRSLKEQNSKLSCMSRSGCDALKDEGSKLQTEVEKVRTDYQKLLEENKKLSLLVNL